MAAPKAIQATPAQLAPTVKTAPKGKTAPTGPKGMPVPPVLKETQVPLALKEPGGVLVTPVRREKPPGVAE